MRLCPRNFFSGIICFEFSVLVLCSAGGDVENYHTTVPLISFFTCEGHLAWHGSYTPPWREGHSSRGTTPSHTPCAGNTFFQRASLLRFIYIFSLTNVPVSGRRDLRGRWGLTDCSKYFPQDIWNEKTGFQIDCDWQKKTGCRQTRSFKSPDIRLLKNKCWRIGVVSSLFFRLSKKNTFFTHVFFFFLERLSHEVDKKFLTGIHRTISLSKGRGWF